MEKGKIYHFDYNGTCYLFKYLETTESQIVKSSCDLNTNTSNFCNTGCVLYSVNSGSSIEATLEECLWLEACERAGKFIPKNEIKFAYEIY